MKVIYETICDRLDLAIRDAERMQKDIRYIELTREEFAQFIREVFRPYTEALLGITNHVYRGVSVRRA